MIEAVEDNLECLSRTLQFNRDYDLLFFRIGSGLVPFASHPICTFDWQDYFTSSFEEIGEFVRSANMRISMHPDQYTLINSVKDDVFDRSVRELAYHAQILDLMKLDASAKIQIHIGGVYGNRERSMNRFTERYFRLNDQIARRLTIENDDKLYCLEDCLRLSSETHVPVLFDVFHHRLNNSGESLSRAFDGFSETWRKHDGVPMVDYSSKMPGGFPGQHAESIDLHDFRAFLEATSKHDFDVILEIKDKEKSALKAVETARSDPRFTIGTSLSGKTY